MERSLFITFLKAIVLGLGLGTLLYLIGFVPLWWISVAVCTILSVVLWCGFHLTHGWHTPRRGRPPEREALRAMALISLIYVGLLLIAVGLVRLLLGISLWANPGLNDGFQRTHRSAMVALRAVKELEVDPGGFGELLLKDGSRLPVSRDRMADVRRRLEAG